ncbi:hypothetical protein Tco_0557817, partial [Tanacetum coccineum]
MIRHVLNPTVKRFKIRGGYDWRAKIRVEGASQEAR